MAILLGPQKNRPSEKTLPLVPLREGVVFPHTEAVLTFGRPKSNAGVEAAFKTDRLIVFVTQKDSIYHVFCFAAQHDLQFPVLFFKFGSCGRRRNELIETRD